MKNCAYIQDLIKLYYLKEIDSQNKQVLDEHLAGCTACQQEFNHTGNLFITLDKQAQEQPPQHILNNMNAKIEQRLAKKSLLVFQLPEFLLPHPLFVPIMAILLVVIGLFVVERMYTNDYETEVAIIAEVEPDTAVLAHNEENISMEAEVLDRIMLAEAEQEAEEEAIIDDSLLLDELGETNTDDDIDDNLDDLEELYATDLA